MWLIALILFWGVVLLLVSVRNRGRGEAQLASGSCPTCQAELANLRPDPQIQPPRSWEVLACPECDIASPVVQGIPQRVGWCPHCKQHALELQVARLPAEPEAPIRVEVHEICHLCNHDEEVVVEQRAWRRGKVIPFPGVRD